jgi:hypothetical protein
MGLSMSPKKENSWVFMFRESEKHLKKNRSHMGLSMFFNESKERKLFFMFRESEKHLKRNLSVPFS